MDSILLSVKKALGIDGDCTDFDTELIMHINTVLSTLTPIGVGNEDGFTISGIDEKWSDFVADEPRWSQIRTYVYTKVRLIFDPPQGTAVVEAMNKVANELEWRLYVIADNLRKEKEENQNGE